MLLLQIAVVTGLFPMIVYTAILWWLDHWEREPLPLVAGVFLWGAVPAVVATVIGSVLLEVVLSVALWNNPEFRDLAGAVLIAPVVEELCKAGALLMLFLFMRHHIDSLLDGILYGAAVGFGFAAVENVLYFATSTDGSPEQVTVLIFLRAIAFGLNHAFYTSLTGLGFAIARFQSQRILRIMAPLVAVAMAMFFHATHNFLVSTSSTGIFLSLMIVWFSLFWMFVIVLASLFHQGTLLRKGIEEEVRLGVITPVQALRACSFKHRLFYGFFLLGIPISKRMNPRRLNQLCGRLALKKYQFSRHGEQVASDEILALRQQVAELSRKLDEANARQY